MRYFNRVHRKAFTSTLIVVRLSLFAMALAFMAGIWLDPYGLYHDAWDPPPTLSKARAPLSAYSYVAKAAAVIREQPTHIILGTSVADSLFLVGGSGARWYQSNNAKTDRIVKAIAGNRSYLNLAIRGGGLREARDFLEHAYANNPKLSHVILGIEWSMFTHTGRQMIPRVDMLGKTHIPLGTYMEYTVTPSAVEKAFQVFDTDIDPELEPARLWVRDLIDAAGSLKQAFQINPAFAQSQPLRLSPMAPSETLVQGNSPMDIYRMAFSIWFSNGSLEHYLRGPVVDELRRIAAFCRDKNIALDVYYSPQHPLFFAAMRRFGAEHQIVHWMREVAAIAPTWDFAELVDFKNPDEIFTTDILHPSDAVGEMMLPLLIGTKPERPQGLVLVTPNNVDAAIERRHRRLTEWLAKHPDMEKSLASVSAERIWPFLREHFPKTLPFAYTPAYKGYTIIGFYGYYAIPTEIAAPYDMHMLLQRKYPGMLDGGTLAEVMANIDARR